MKGLVLGWVFAASFYTCLDVTLKAQIIYGGNSHYILYTGMLTNVVMNYVLMGLLRRNNPWKQSGGGY